MRKILSIAFILVLLSAAVAKAEGPKTVFFDLQSVVEQCDPLKDAKTALEAKFGPQKAGIEKERVALEKKAREYATKKPTQKQQDAFIQEQRAYQEKASSFLQLVQADEQVVRADIETVVQAAAKSLAETKGYELILDAVAVPYGDPKLNITNDMLTEVNRIWKISEENRKKREAEGKK